MKNSLAFLELTFAISHLGAVSLPLNYRLAAEEVGDIIDNAGAGIRQEKRPGKGPGANLSWLWRRAAP